MGGVNLFGNDACLSDSQRTFLKTVAGMAYGTGFFEGAKGGKGNMGLWCDTKGKMHVVKFNTHGSQAEKAQKALGDSLNRGEKSEMLNSSERLRNELRKIAVQLGMSADEQNALLGGVKDPPKLLTRRTVAKFISAAQTHKMAGDALADIWSDGATFTSKSDMSFETVTDDRNLENYTRIVQDSGEEVFKLFTALNSLCKNRTATVDTEVSFNGLSLRLKCSSDGKVRLQYEKEGNKNLLLKNWVTSGFTVQELRTRMFFETLASGGFFRKEGMADTLDDMSEALNDASAKQQKDFRTCCVLYLKGRTGLNNDMFESISTAQLLRFAIEVGKNADDGSVRKEAQDQLHDLARQENVGLENSMDSLALLKVAKSETKIKDKVQFEAPKTDESRSKTEDGSLKFRRLAADMVKLFDSSSVDEKLCSPEMKNKITKECTYVNEQMKILNMSEEELKNCEFEVRVRNQYLQDQLKKHMKSAQKVPANLLIQRLTQVIATWKGTSDDNGAFYDELAKEKLTVMEDTFSKNKKDEVKQFTIEGVGLSEDTKVDRYDKNRLVNVYMREPGGDWKYQSKQIPLFTALKGMFGENEDKVKFSFSNSGKTDDSLRVLLEEMKDLSQGVFRPTMDDAREVVLKELPKIVRKLFFNSDGTSRLEEMGQKVSKLEADKDALAKEIAKAKQTKDKVRIDKLNKEKSSVVNALKSVRFELALVKKYAYFPEDVVTSWSKELLRRELLEEWSKGNEEIPSHDMVEFWRLHEVVKSNKDALVELIMNPDIARNISSDVVENDVLSILVQDGGLCKMLGISESERLEKSVVLEKIDKFIETASNPSGNSCEMVRKLNASVRDVVRGQLLQTQEEFSQLVDEAFQQINTGRTGFEFKNFSIINKTLSKQDVKSNKRTYESISRPHVESLENYSDGELFNTVGGVRGRGRGHEYFLSLVLKRYFKHLPPQGCLSLISSRLRHSSDVSSRAEQLGAFLKGAGPLLLKMLQAFNPPKGSVLATALADVKENLSPIPEKMLEAHLLDIVNRSDGQIEKISVKKTLGCASVGQTLLCHVEGPGIQQKGGMDVVVKILRPDALNALRREREIMLECAKEAGMESVYKSVIDKTLEEFDLTVEAKNIEASEVYNGEDKGVHTLKALPIVRPDHGTLVLELAPGKTVSTIVTDIETEFKLRERIDSAPIDSNAAKEDPYGTYISNLEKKKKEMEKYDLLYKAPEARGDALQKIKEKIEELRDVHTYLSKLTGIWVREGCTPNGSGFYHGDLHGGNIMFDPKKGLTTIDLGNATVLDPKSKEAFSELLKYCSEVSHLKLRTHLFAGEGNNKDECYRDDVTMEWIRTKLSPLADKVFETLKKIISTEQVERLEGEYNDKQQRVTCRHVDNSDEETFSCLKHEIMLALSTPGFSPEPFGRFSLILKRLECHGISVPESFSRFMTAALRLKNEVDNVRERESQMLYVLQEQFNKAPCKKAPDVFGFLKGLQLQCVIDSKFGTLKFEIEPPSMEEKEVQNRTTTLIATIKNVRSSDSTWKEFREQVEWLGNEDLAKKLDAFWKNKNSEDAVQELANAICEKDKAECENMAKVYTEVTKGLTIKKNPYEQNSVKLLNFTQVFNDAYSNESKHPKRHGGGEVLIKV